jgi:ABC-type branched-subunit amino acid transport system substrate-binding protein
MCKKNHSWRYICLLALGTCLLFSGVVWGDGPDKILIGINAPLTGMHAGFGEGNVYGEKAAVEDINKQGGLHIKKYNRKIPIELVIVDNESDPKKAASLTENLILKNKVHFLAPPNQPIPLAIPQAITAERHKVIRVSGGTPEEPWLAVRNESAPKWDHTWTYTLAIAAPSATGSPTAKPGYTCMDSWMGILDEFKKKTNNQVGIFASDEPDGRGWYEVIPKVLADQGFDVHVENNLGLFPLDAMDFSSMIRKWKRLKVEVIWGNAPAPLFGTMWKQCKAMGFNPKMVIATRAGLFYEDVSAWGGDLPVGISGEAWWSPAFDPKYCKGIGGTTPMSLFERWKKDTGKPLNPGIGWGYNGIQILADAVERAGSLESEAVRQALAKTDMSTISSPRVTFNENQSARLPIFFAQWHKVDKPWKWESKVVSSFHDFLPKEAEMLFPIP